MSPDQPVARTSDPDLGRVVTIPNAISLGRLLCVPLFLWLGFIARRYNQVSTVGKVLDPAADRLLLAVGVIAILVYGAVPPVIAWLAIAREGSVAVLALVLAALGARRIDVSWWGKTGTFLLMIAFPLFLLGDGHGPAHAVAWAVSVAGLLAGWYANLLYIPQGRQALRDGRRAKKAPAAQANQNQTENREIRG